MQSSLTRHTIGPWIVSSEEDDYPLNAPSLLDFTKPAPRPLFDDGSDQGFAPSSPPTEGGGTLSSINPTQCIVPTRMTTRWVNLMDLLKVMKARAPEVHAALKMFLGDSVRKTVAAQQAVKDSKSEEDGNEDGDFMSWKDIEVTMLPDRAGPSGSQDVSEHPVGGTLPTTSALLPLASSAPASPAPASSAPASSTPASSIRASAVQAPAASSLNTTDIEEETELDS
ncbi:hypothetical protein C8Q72DRAFT_796574 [Fomitopsis betulina]|nr:hypothetical protein C8Q72DRAFT_796574 [Fomitopsis betulina]